MATLADKLQKMRVARGLSQKQVAELVGVSQQQVSMWERDVIPSTEIVAHIARIFDVTSDWLLGLVEDPTTRVQTADLSNDEWMLINLYRHGKLPSYIRAMVSDLAERKAKEDVAMQGDQKPLVPGE